MQFKNIGWEETLEAQGVERRIIDTFEGDIKEDFRKAMHFLCNEWTPPETGRKGCMVTIRDNNLEAYQVWSTLAGSKAPTDIKAACELWGVVDVEDCYQRILRLMKGK